MVARQAEQVAHAERAGAEYVGLDRQTVAVAAGHLHDGLQARLYQERASRHAAQPHDGRLVVRHVHGIALAAQQTDLAPNHLDVRALWRAHLGRNGKGAGGEDTFEVAPALHGTMSSRTTLRGPPWRDGRQSLGGSTVIRRSNWPRRVMRS